MVAEAGLAVAGVEARLAGRSWVTPAGRRVAHRIRAEATDGWDDTAAAAADRPTAPSRRQCMALADRP